MPRRKTELLRDYVTGESVAPGERFYLCAMEYADRVFIIRERSLDRVKGQGAVLIPVRYAPK